MKKFNFFEKLWEHGRTLKRVGMVFALCLITITQVWAWDNVQVTFYTIGCYFSNPVSWDYANSSISVDIRYRGENNKFDNNSANVSSNWAMTNTGKTYLGFPIYECTFTSTDNGGQIRFKHYVSGTFKENYVANWEEPGTMNGHLYLGYFAGRHNWVPYDADNLHPIYLDLAQYQPDGGGWQKDGATFKMYDETNTVYGVYIKDKLYAFSCTTASPTKVTFYRMSSDGNTQNNTFWTYTNNDYNTYKVTGWNTGACANDNINLVTKTTRVYFDNSQLGVAGQKYLVIGRDNFSAYSKVYTPTASISNTNLFYYEISSDVWRDATYYGFAGPSSSWSNGNWGSSNLSNGTKYTAAYKSQFDLAAGHITVFSTASGSNGTAITPTYKGTVASSLNSTQTIKYAISIDNGSTYSELTDGNTPAQLQISAYRFNDGTYNNVSASSNTQTISANSTTYSASVPAGYASKTTFSYGSLQGGYTFVDWKDAPNGSAIASPYYPTGEKTVYARFKANQYTVTLNGNSGSGGTASVKATYGVSSLPSITNPTRSGYEFAGWFTGSGGTGKLVIDIDGSLQPGISGFTDADGKWIATSNQNVYAGWLIAHEPGVYTNTYGQPLTISSCGAYEVYRYAVSSSTIYVNAGGESAPITSSDDRRLFSFSQTSSSGACSYTWFGNWIGHTETYGKDTETATASGEFKAHSVCQPKCRDQQGFIICVSGYSEFSIYAKDNATSDGQNFKVFINGVNQSMTLSKSWTVRRFALTPANTYIIRVTGQTNNNNQIQGFSLKLPDYPAPSALAASSITSSGATLTVTDSYETNNYELYVSEDDDTPAANADPSYSIDGDNSIDVDDLEAGTTYYAWVRSVCDTRKSSWVALTGDSFTTEDDASCTTPSSASITGTTTYLAGETIELTASATGTDEGTTYQWYKGDPTNGGVSQGDASTSGATFTKASCAVADAATYYCVISNGDGCEATVSQAITVVYQVTYDKNGGSGSQMAASRSTSITLSANGYTAPSGYTFDGWRTVSDKYASGTDYAAGATGITANLSLYAMWKQTATLSTNGSVVLYYNASHASSTPSAPTYTDHTVDLGYYAESGCTNKVMGTDGSLTNYTGYVVGGKWVYSGDITLYPHWKVDAPSSITCTDNVVTISVPTDATVHYTIDGSNPTSSSATYDPANKPVITSSGITVKAIAVQSGCTNSEITSQAVDYTPVYTVGFTTTNASKSTGAATVLENHEYTATYTTVTGYNLPSTVSVTVGDDALTQGTDFTWSVSKGTGTLTILENVIGGNVAITVSGVAKTYTLTLDKNGGNADGTATATYNQHSLASITDATCALTHYTLGGYYTEADGGVLLVTASGTPRYLSAENADHDAELATWLSAYTGRNWIYDDDLTLYAHWWINITLNHNADHHGTGSYGSAKGIYNGSALKDISHTTGESGYTRLGYYTTPDGGTKILNADGSFAAENITDYVSDGKWIYSGEDYVTLYAHWGKQYTVTYDGNGNDDGDAPSAVEDQIFGTEITVASKGTLAKTDYTFVGWNTEDDGSGTFYAAGSKFTLTDDITLYAQWADCSGGGSTTIFSLTSITGAGSALGSSQGVGVSYDASSYCTLSSGDGAYVCACSSSGSISGKNVTYNSTHNTWTFGADKTFIALYSTTGFAAGDVITWVVGENVTYSPNFAYASASTLDGLKSTDYLTSAATYGLTMTSVTAPASGNSYTYTGTLPTGFVSSHWLIVYRNGQSFKLKSLTVTRSGGGSGCDYYDVSFADMDGFAGTSTLPNKIEDVLDGSKIAEPVIPSATGYVFGGWYKDDDCTDAWDFSTDVVDDDITLYAKWVDVSGKYTFHYGGGEASDNTWMIIPFTQEGTSSYYNIEDFIVPNTTKYPSFFVGYEGAYDTENAKSTIYDWDDTYTYSLKTHGRMPILHTGISNQSNCPLSAEGQMADGAKGTLRIGLYGSSNQGVGFIPDGFALDWERGTTVLHATTNPKVFETDVVTLTSAEAAGNFEVKLATDDENEFVAYARTAEDDVDDLDDRKVSGEDYDIEEGAVGRFQINLSKTDNNFGLRFVPLVNRTTEYQSNWEDDDKWTLWRRPTIDETAYVAHMINVNQPNAQANDIIVDKTNGGYPHLYIKSEYAGVGGLLVKKHIQVQTLEDETPTLSDNVSYSELSIRSSQYGSGALIMGDASETTAASVELYSKACRDEFGGWVNQYIGTPSAEGSIYDFYGSYLYVFSPVNGSWVQANRQASSAMPPFKAYNLMREELAPGSYSLYDPLVFPGITDGKQKVLTCDDENDETTPEENRTGWYMFANSWTAPIDVKAMKTTDFVGVEPTIYIFNAGTKAQKESAASPANDAIAPGQWVSLPVAAAPWLENELPLTVIPSMQAFRIQATDATAKLTLDYKKHVYDPAINNAAAGIEIKPLRAPKRDLGYGKPNVLQILVDGESGYKDNLFILEREDFTEDFDNGWDGRKIFGISAAPQIYGVCGDNKRAIDAISDMEGKEVGFKTGTADSEYTITFKYEGDDVWYFNDTKEQEATLITNDAEYIFSTESGENTNRFYISASPIQKVPTSIENPVTDPQNSKVRKVIINDHIYIIRGGQMYSVDGALVK